MDKSILIIDDDKDMVRIYTDILENIGCRLYTAANAVEGFKIYQQNRIDLIVTDKDMPLLDGIEFLTALKKRYPDVKVIVASGYINNDDIQRYEQRYTNVRVLKKPFDLSEFTHIVTSLLELPAPDDV